MMARNTNVPIKGRIQKRESDDLEVMGLARLATRGRSIQMGQKAT